MSPSSGGSLREGTCLPSQTKDFSVSYCLRFIWFSAWSYSALVSACLVHMCVGRGLFGGWGMSEALTLFYPHA